MSYPIRPHLLLQSPGNPLSYSCVLHPTPHTPRSWNPALCTPVLDCYRFLVFELRQSHPRPVGRFKGIGLQSLCILSLVRWCLWPVFFSLQIMRLISDFLGISKSKNKTLPGYASASSWLVSRGRPAGSAPPWPAARPSA